MYEFLKQRDAAPETERDENSVISRRTFLAAAGAIVGSMLIEDIPDAEAAINTLLSEGREKKTGTPGISVNIFFGVHHLAEDVRDLPKKFAEADIFIPEAAGWNKKALTDERALADGKITPEELLKKYHDTPENDPLYSFRESELRMLYNSHKPIFVVDLPEGHPLLKRFGEAEQHYLAITIGKRLADMRSLMKRYIAESTDFQKEREVYILTELKRTLSRIQEKPQSVSGLKGKEKINVLLFFGAFHTRIHHRLNRTEQKSIRTFNETPMIFPYDIEASRRLLFGKELDDELLTRCVLEKFILPYLGERLAPFAPSTVTIYKFDRIVLSHFSTEEIEMMFDEAEPGENGTKKFYANFEKMLEKKGIRMPSSEQELDMMLQKKYPTQKHTK